MKKLSNTEAELKKSVAYEKSVQVIRLLPLCGDYLQVTGLLFPAQVSKGNYLGY